MTANSPLQRVGQEKGIAMGSQELQRKLGFWAVLAIAVGTTVGSGILYLWVKWQKRRARRG
ncbi:hypothetical protein E9Y40_000602 [Escherichia coli]|nr:hypothetical protein [Escherichia coli]